METIAVANMTAEMAPQLTRDQAIRGIKQQKKSGNSLSWLCLAALVILLSIGLFRMLSRSGEKRDTVTVVAAAMDIPAGCRVSFSQLHYITIPRRYFKEAMPTSYHEVAGRITRTFIPVREPILAGYLFPSTDSLSLQVDSRQRAITLNLTEDSLVDHAICPGDYVDVLVTAVKDGKKFTKTLCQAVLVLLAVPKEQMLSRASSIASHNRITLAVTPEQSEQLAEAVEAGKVRLVLRNRLSVNHVPMLPGVSEADLLPAAALQLEQKWQPEARPGDLLPPPPAVSANDAILERVQGAVEQPLKWVVEIFSGSQKTVVAVPKN